jgi:hypothetical protein
MAANSEIILVSQTHDSLNADPIVVYGDKAKGAGYYGFGHSSHTVELEVTIFQGTFKIQGTLATNPQDGDWVDITLLDQNILTIDTTGLISRDTGFRTVTFTHPTTTARIFNFSGNFTWIRAVIEDWTAGSINRVLLNH